jgi:type IV secretory pathway TraG/TraD family ATPase VirD4
MAELFSQTRSNAELLELLQGNLAQLKTFLSGTMAYRYLEEAKVATSVLSTAANYCQFYKSLVVPQGRFLSFYEWGACNSPRWIFVTLNEDDAELFKPLYSLVFELMLKGLLSEHERTRKTAIIIDELGALNQLPSLSRLLSESRKFLGCPILGTQTEAQITKVYGREDTRILLQGTKTKLILNCSDPQTAEKMAQVIGKQERVELTNNRNRSRSSSSRGTGSGSSYGENEQLREVYAVMPSELQDLPDLKGYLKISGFPAAQVKVKVRNFLVQAERFIPRSQASERTDTNAQSIQEQWKRLRS